MHSYIQNGKYFSLVSTPPENRKALPARCYLLKQNKEGIYLEQAESFVLPSKFYGSLEKTAERIIRTFNSREKSTGVLLSGERGSGKTLLAELICTKLAKTQNLPTILINGRLENGGSLSEVIATIPDNAVVLFDEFEKNFETGDQVDLLTLLDGVFQTKKLFILTCNQRSHINENFINRPGRIFYSIPFDGLGDDFIAEYAADTLVNKGQLEKLLSTLTIFGKINFDMLKAIVEEMNRYNESATEALKLLNCHPDSSYAAFGQYMVSDFVYKGYKVELEDEIWLGNPFGEKPTFVIIRPEALLSVPGFKATGTPTTYLTGEYYADHHKEGLGDLVDFDEKFGAMVVFKPSDLVKVDGRSQTFLYEYPNKKARMTLKKQPAKKINRYEFPT